MFDSGLSAFQFVRGMRKLLAKALNFWRNVANIR